MELARAIEEHLSEWDEPAVERAIFGSDDPDEIAQRIDRATTDTLGSPVRDCVFYRTSVGCVAGLTLDDDRRVVMKAHRSRVRRERLEAVQRVLRELNAVSFPCPEALGGPTLLEGGHATFESLVDAGVQRDGHDPAVRRELAARLAELARVVPVTPALDALGRSWFTGVPRDRLWPTPHSPIFDFEATSEGAEPIDALAAEARRVPLAGERVVGHFDWRAEHARFEGDRMVVAYDWDSLHVELEPAVVGAASHAHCADWEDDTLPAAPTLDELRAFVADYEAARGRPFEGDERRTLAGSAVYSLAYTARCAHALGARATRRALAFRELLETHGRRLLESL